MDESDQTLRLPADFLDRFPPDREALFTFIRAQVTDEMLAVIADADNGSSKAEHFEALERIRAGVGLDQPMQWVPNEVLSLFRWGEPKGERHLREPVTFHVARAFTCGALLRVPDINQNRSIYANEALAPLIESCLALGEPFHSRLLKQLTWSLENMDEEDGEYVFHAFGLFVVFVRGGYGDPETHLLLGKWLLRVNRVSLSRSEWAPWGCETFLDAAFASVTPRRWRRLAQAVRATGEFDKEISVFLERLCP